MPVVIFQGCPWTKDLEALLRPHGAGAHALTMEAVVMLSKLNTIPVFLSFAPAAILYPWLAFRQSD